MKIVSFNVNGIRAAINKGFFDWIESESFDIICTQETKANETQIELTRLKDLGYNIVFNSAEKKGYSGTAIFSKPEILSLKTNFDNYFDKEYFNDSYGNLLSEGRIIVAEYKDFFLINTYVPNVKNDLSRLNIRYNIWDKKILEYIKYLEKTKALILCGDMNVAHQEIDLANPKPNEGAAGFTKEEREGFSNFTNADLIDIFRYFYPQKQEYTWWSMRTKARERNIGWRIDYFLCSKKIIRTVKEISILNNVIMSDHCPILLEL